MSNRVFLLKGNNQYFKSDEFVAESTFSAFYGFSILSWDIIPFTEISEDLSKHDIVVAGIGTMHKTFKHLGVELPAVIDYPEELSDFYGRKIWSDNLKNVYLKEELWPIFVKPKKQKLFTGKFIKTVKDVIGLGADDAVDIWCSEPMEFVSEWRCYVRYGKILGVHLYAGDWSKVPNRKFIENTIEVYKSQPAGYGIDFGITEDGRIAVVEVNDGFSLGNYGLPCVKYAKLISARWYEIMGLPDPLQMI